MMVTHIWKANVQTPEHLLRYLRIVEAIATRMAGDRHLALEERLVHKGRAIALQDTITLLEGVVDHVATFYTHNPVVEQMVEDAVALAEERWEAEQ